MELLSLLRTHWFDLLQSAAIVAGLVYTARSFSLDWRSRRAEVVLEITSAHRKTWSKIFDEPELARLLETEPHLHSEPITEDEVHFVLLVLIHLASVHQAIELGLYRSWPGIEEDIRRFFTLPIPREILRQHLPLQPPGFRRYIIEILEYHPPKKEKP